MTDSVCEMGAGKTEQAFWQHRQRHVALFFLSSCCVRIQDNAKLSVIQSKFSRCQACRSHPPFCFLRKCKFSQHYPCLMEAMQSSITILHHRNVKRMSDYQDDIRTTRYLKEAQANVEPTLMTKELQAGNLLLFQPPSTMITWLLFIYNRY